MQILNTTLCYIEQKGKYLMLHRVKKQNDINKDKWIGVGGKVEFGESPEDCVRREVKEETGLKVKNIRYYKSQPWGMAQDILTGFYCEVDGDDTIRMDESELKYAAWVKREDIELQPNNLSLTNEMMKVFKDGIYR